MIYPMPGCGGCRTCEMVCAYHHKGVFAPSASSIKIVENEDRSGYRVELLSATTAEGMACDLCGGLDVPLCVQHCREAAELQDILANFKKTGGIPVPE